MQCPICGGKAKVIDTNPLPGRTRRKLRCVEQNHEFSTEEGRVGWRLTHDVHVRQSGNHQVQPEPFQPERLRQEVGQAVLGRLTEAQIADVVDGAIAHLRYDVVPRMAEPLEGEEYDHAVVLVRMGQHNAGKIKHAQLSYYPKIGHAPFWEDAERFNRELREFASLL